VAATGVAAVIGVLVAGRELPGLAVTLGVLAAGCLALLADRRVRAALKNVRTQLRPTHNRPARNEPARNEPARNEPARNEEASS
jgi:hypothetical protein